MKSISHLRENLISIAAQVVWNWRILFLTQHFQNCDTEWAKFN